MADAIANRDDVVTLLVITDELGSSERRDRDKIIQRTAKHFASFLRLLAAPLCASKNTILVKNVGDSLMMRVELERSPRAICELLRSILMVQEQLHVDHSTDESIDIRVLVALCDGKEVQGEEIHDSLLKALSPPDNPCTISQPKIPGPRNGNCWLWGDLFGVAVSRAFRAAGIPKGRELVVEDDVSQVVQSTLGPRGGVAEGLKFGPRVAFSPIKGMEDLYNVRSETLDKKQRREHVWLRTVSCASEGLNVGFEIDPLESRQQNIRVITELMLDDGDSIVAKWREVLNHVENGAEYFRFVGKVVKQQTWTFPPGGRTHPKNGPSGRLILLGAYPEFDTYFNVREGLLANKEYLYRTHRLRYGVTNILWEPRQLTQKKHWPRAPVGEKFAVLLAVTPRIQDNPEHYTDSQWAALLDEAEESGSLRRCGLERFDDGIVMGEWNYYAILRAGSTVPTWTSVEKVFAQPTKLRKLRFYGCEVI